MCFYIGGDTTGIMFCYQIDEAYFKGGFYLNAIFTPPNMGLMEVSRSRFKQSKNASLISQRICKS